MWRQLLVSHLSLQPHLRRMCAAAASLENEDGILIFPLAAYET
jgi:hypothetical protein